MTPIPTRYAGYSGLLAACCSLFALALVACGEDGTPPASLAAIDAAVLDATSADATGADAGVARDAGPDLGPPAEFEAFIDYQMRVGGIRGLAASIIEDGAIARTVTRGFATETAPVDEHTLFVAASISKTFVAAVLLQLAEEGLLDLDAPLDDILGFVVRHPDFPDVPITARLLMTHTSGLVDDFGTLAGYTVTDGADPTTTLDQVSREYIADPSHFDAQPGTAFSYANIGFALLGRTAEVAGGDDLRGLSQDRLFGPLALDGAGWFYADVDAERLAIEYSWSQRTDIYTAQPQRNYAQYPATSLRISITALSRWLLTHILGGTLDGVSLLETESVTATRTPTFPAISGGQALVWYYSNHGGRRWLGHSGSSFGASNQMLYDPATGRGIVVLTNSDAYIRSRFGREEGSEALEAIIARLDAEADLL